MYLIKLLASVIILLKFVCGNHNLKLVYQWKTLDYQFESEIARNQSMQNGSFSPENISIHGIEVSDDRMFITTPRWLKGVWATLSFIYLNDTSMSPKLIPYPNMAIHAGNPPDMVSPYRPRKDSCGRLWVPDTGFDDYLGDLKKYPPAFHIFNLTTNERILKYTFPEDQLTSVSYMATIALEVINCDDVYAYFGDIRSPGLIVYSYKDKRSWTIKHPFFERNPLASDYNVNGINFHWNEGIFGIALSNLGRDNYSTLYFSPMTSFDQFEVSTKVLRNPTPLINSYHEFKHLGSRGLNSQCGPQAYHQKSGVLFYGNLNRNSVGCWNSNLTFNETTQGTVHEDNVEMITPADVNIDNDDLWVLSDRLIVLMFSKINHSEFNYRIFKGTIEDAINGTVCNITAKSEGTVTNLTGILSIWMAAFYVFSIGYWR